MEENQNNEQNNENVVQNEQPNENAVQNEQANEGAVQNEQPTEPVTDETTNFNFSEEVKQEAKQTVNQVKDTIKNTNLKKDTEAAKGFFKSFFKNPIETVKNVASDNKASFLKFAIIVLVVWLVAILLCRVLRIANTYLFGPFGSFSYLIPNFFSLIKELITPVIAIVLLSVLVYLFKKNKNKSMLTIMSTITIANIPMIIADIAGILTIFGINFSSFSSYFLTFCRILNAVLLFFGIKELVNEDDKNNYFWKFALIMGIYCAIRFVLSYLKIYI